MAKKGTLGRIILFCAAAGAAAAALFFYLKQGDDDFTDDFDDDQDDDLGSDDQDQRGSGRKYVSLSRDDIDSEEIEEDDFSGTADLVREDGATPSDTEEFFDDEAEEAS